MPSFRERVPGLASLMVTVFASFSLAAPAHGQSWPTISMSPPITGFNEPVHITNARDGSGRLFVSEEHGRILIVRNGVVSSTPFLDLSTRVGTHHVHGVAFPPNYASKKHFYVKYTDAACNIVLSRFGLTANPDVADLNSEQIVLSFTHLPGDCDHSGSAPAFSPVDGFLYTAVGNGTESCQQPHRYLARPGDVSGQDVAHRCRNRQSRDLYRPRHEPVRQHAWLSSRNLAAGMAQSLAHVLRHANRRSIHGRCRRGHSTKRSIFRRRPAPAARTMVGESWKELIASAAARATPPVSHCRLSSMTIPRAAP